MKQSRKRSNIVPLKVDARTTNALKYKPEYCQLVVEQARLGEFPEQWCTLIKISLSTMYNWANRYAEFDEACKLAWTCLSSHWTRELVNQARSGTGDTSAILHILKKRFPDTWGSDAKNTCANFTATIQGGKVQPVTNLGDTLEDMSSEDLRVKLKELRDAQISQT